MMVETEMIEDKPHPIDPDVFAKTHRPWDEPEAMLTVTRAHLQKSGCPLYYKIAGVWEKQLNTEVWIQEMESDEPILTLADTWLCIGIEGEPWRVTEMSFQEALCYSPLSDGYIYFREDSMLDHL